MHLPLLSVLSLLSAAPSSPTERLCVDRAPCTLTETLDAGKDAQGQALQVKHLSLGWATPEEPSLSERHAFGGGREAQAGPSQERCEAQEWWLLRPATAPQLLLATCAAASGPLRLSKDEVKLGPNTFTRSIAGGDDSRRWTQSLTIQLDPLACRGESHRTFSASSPDKANGVDWDSQRLEGRVLAPVPHCGEEGARGKKPVPAAYAQEDLSLPELPQLVNETGPRDAWRQVGLGDCALMARSLPPGKQEEPANSSLKALLVGPSTLLLEVRDDHWTGPSKQWLADDHVELWLGPEQPDKLNRCTPPTPQERPVQWALRIADGKVFPGYGPPKKALQVRKSELREAGALVGYLLEVELPMSFGGISVVYSDSDPGKKPERVLATSPLKSARPETFNGVRPVTSVELTCQVRGGVMRAVSTPMKLEDADSAMHACE